MSQQLLSDPFYGQIIASIAVTTALADKDAQESGQQFTDSQIKSVVHRVIQKLEGKPPKQKEPTSEKERRQSELYDELVKLRGTIIVTHRETGEKSPLSATMYLRAMRATKDSIMQRRTGETGERGYLEYAKATLARVEAQPDEEEKSES